MRAIRMLRIYMNELSSKIQSIMVKYLFSWIYAWKSICRSKWKFWIESRSATTSMLSSSLEKDRVLFDVLTFLKGFKAKMKLAMLDEVSLG